MLEFTLISQQWKIMIQKECEDVTAVPCRSFHLHHILHTHSLSLQAPSVYMRGALLFAGGQSSLLRPVCFLHLKIQHFLLFMPPEHNF